MMEFRGKAKRIEDIDLPRIGFRIGVGEDEIHAILDVESAGKGFDAKGRPKMLFEPHVFYRELGPGAARNEAALHGLARPRWKRDYPADSYPRLHRAMDLCRRHGVSIESALRSASWGLGQIMGFNHSAAGYYTAEAMVEAFKDDEDKHLDAMISFIVANNLDDELRRHDWAGFAKGYNGTGFAQNGYDKKLSASFAKWQKIKDTPFTPQNRPSTPVKPSQATPAAGNPSSLLTALLRALAAIFKKRN
jgi:hypothetical protein